jgi:hypothetical protein
MRGLKLHESGMQGGQHGSHTGTQIGTWRHTLKVSQ